VYDQLLRRSESRGCSSREDDSRDARLRQATQTAECEA
jgi:hypothetical protein